MMLHLLLGRRGERATEKFLRRARRYRLVVRNYVCPAGEIDLIFLDGDTLVFVEVKTRRPSEASDPEDAVGARKRVQMERAARYFLMKYRAQDRAARFDVVAVTWPPRGKPQIEHFPNAFAARPS